MGFVVVVLGNFIKTQVQFYQNCAQTQRSNIVNNIQVSQQPGKGLWKRQTHTHTHTHTQTDRQTDTHTHTHRQTDRHTHTHTHTRTKDIKVTEVMNPICRCFSTCFQFGTATMYNAKNQGQNRAYVVKHCLVVQSCKVPTPPFSGMVISVCRIANGVCGR
jgi:hypothetical protein